MFTALQEDPFSTKFVTIRHVGTAVVEHPAHNAAFSKSQNKFRAGFGQMEAVQTQSLVQVRGTQ